MVYRSDFEENIAPNKTILYLYDLNLTTEMLKDILQKFKKDYLRRGFKRRKIFITINTGISKKLNVTHGHYIVLFLCFTVYL